MSSSLQYIIGIGSYILTACTFIRISKILPEQVLSSHNEWILLGGSIIRILLTLIRNTQDTNTKHLKSILIKIQIYLVLLLSVYPSLNLHRAEFLVCYGCILLLIHGVYQKPINYRETGIGVIGTLLFFSLHLLMIYRVNPQEKEFYQQESYNIYAITENNSKNDNYPDQLLIQAKGKKTDHYLLSGKKNIVLQKNTNYTISYLSQSEKSKTTILLQDPEGNLIHIERLKTIHISTRDKDFLTQIKEQEKVIRINEIRNDPMIKAVQEDYKAKKKKYLLATLPRVFQNSSFLQKLSYNYTSSLAKIFPWYQKNKRIADSYYTLFDKNVKSKNTTQKQSIRNKNIKKIDINWGKTEILGKIKRKISTRF